MRATVTINLPDGKELTCEAEGDCPDEFLSAVCVLFPEHTSVMMTFTPERDQREVH